MREILLTQNQVALVDDEDFEYLNQWKWHAHKKSAYYARRTTSRLEGYPRATIYMHQAVLSCPSGKVIDHIDHNGLNNQKSNLQIVTSTENSGLNKSKNRDIPYVGVTRVKQKFQAQITRKRKSLYIGLFDTAEAAALAYDAAIREHYAGDGYINFPQTSVGGGQK